MVLGLRSKTRKGISVQVDYIVYVQEIKPWPPSQSFRSVETVLLQWENGDQNSGFISAVVGDSTIEFNEPLMLPLTLCREKKTRDNFQKNCLEFYLYESRKDKAAKGQLLGTAIINLADYGIINDDLTISALVNCKKSSKNSAQPVLYVNVQPFDKDSSTQSPNDSLSKEASLDKDGGEFVKELINVANDHESDISFLTDDDNSSHSSHTISSSAFEADSSLSQNKVVANEKGKTEEISHESNRDNAEDELASKVALSGAYVKNGVNYDLVTSGDSQANGIDFRQQVMRQSENSHLDATTINKVRADLVDEKMENKRQEYDKGENMEKKSDVLENQFVDKSSRDVSRKHAALRSETLSSRRASTNSKLKHMMSVQLSHNSDGFSGESLNVVKAKELDKRAQGRHNTRINDISGSENAEKAKEIDKRAQAQHNAKSNDISGSENVVKAKEIVKRTQAQHNARTNDTSEGSKLSSGSSESKPEWRSRIEMLEEELREAAIVEAALYSVVAEHGSSTNKVHAPARRLSRFYLHAGKARSFAKRASAARTAVSGLILVSKSCGNDVPRLTFWLSNSIMLRAIINQAIQKTPLKSNVKTNNGENPSGGRSSWAPHKISSNGKERDYPLQESGDWENPQTFVIALEKVEAWIFSRIVESVWWQTLTPHMQPTAAKNSGKGSSSRKNKNVLGDQEQGSFSIELWKKAFKDACERLCPIRAGGHECGCLPVLSRLVMEQLVDRLDVAMFNAILRESAEEMPTDPVSDPISDRKVLPIPAGRSSFGAGAQLKNCIGSWSRWLSDLFGIEENDLPEDETNDADNSGIESGHSFKVFRLLNALSDLMMLPIEMLADSHTRKEVCPIFSALLIKAVLNNFVPDEFSPEPITAAILDALDSEDAEEDSEKLVTFPCTATSTVYSPPLAASLAGFIGEVGSQTLQRSASSVLRKSYTSDDELDELDSPITSIFIDKFRVSSSNKLEGMPKGGQNAVRYQLLREVWREGE